MKRTHGLDEREMEQAKLLMAECHTTWISGNESASFYASICSDLKNRGV